MSNLVDHSYYKTGNGWMYAYENGSIYFGKTDGKAFNGPGILITYRENPSSDYSTEYYKFRTGIFSNGQLVNGMRVKDFMKAVDKEKVLQTRDYKLELTTIVQGKFKNDMLEASCGRITTLDSKGDLIRLVEGYIVPGYSQEVADGWVYLNDWSGKRSAANLRFMYNNYNYFDIEPSYDSWIKNGYKTALKENYCFGTMASQAAPVIPLIKAKHDSVMAMIEKRMAELAAERAAAEKRRQICAEKMVNQPYRTGQLYKIGSELVLIAGSFWCDAQSFPVISQRWVQTTKNTGFKSAAATHISVKELANAQQMPGEYYLCGRCLGMGTTPMTVYSEVGGNSGYTNIGGGWKVKNPETYWKSETMVTCSVCKGVGFTMK